MLQLAQKRTNPAFLFSLYPKDLMMAVLVMRDRFKYFFF
ncbi:hypothetical protein C1G86_0096 [Dehalococcoides mccartyi]|uniref:Uncharacterized protein n=1 Tax=Dehalococcoides mccartyi TaxID=61435 RepID=A0A328EU07_9CHLR|nr:hypothetical protein C1G87_0129 [Dehalococcoides mccartyi]RAL71148.1 hypothetical protein C1G86_0096 [Dehalococcoides mccartyi]